MSDFLLEWGGAIWQVLVESGPYLLVGFLLAGLIKVLIPEEKVFRYLGKDDFRSVFIASCVGAPIPLCSCSVIPTALALRKSGASKGATTSFLIATPETGVDSIGLTWALMDPIMTIARPVAALLTAIGCGSLVNLLVRRKLDDPGAADNDDQQEQTRSCCQETEGAAESETDPDRICCADQARTSERKGLASVLKRAVRYGYGSLMSDLTPWFILGFMVSGLIMVLVPDDILGTMLPQGFNWLTMLLMLVIGIPLYICATASTPVAAALVAKGLDPGAALVLLLAGPATNVSTLLFVRGFLGKRVLSIYLAGIAVACLALGFLVNLVYSLLEIDPVTTVTSMDGMSAGLISLVSGAALLLLLVVHAVRLNLASAVGARFQKWCALFGFNPFSTLSKSCLALFVLLAVATTAYTVVLPGEVGFLVRFGEVRQEVRTPELLLHAPYPLDRVEKVQADNVRSLEFGFDSSDLSRPWSLEQDESSRRDFDAESEVVAGDESLLRINYVVHYSVADARSFRYGLEDPDELVRVLTEAALRCVVAQHNSDEILVASRDRLQEEIGRLLSADLERLGSGIALRSVIMLDVHSPPQTHYAYRDVASAQEDKLRSTRRAEGYQVEHLSLARAAAYRLLQEAEAKQRAVLDRARGEVAAFLALAAEPRVMSDVNLLRLRREAAEKALAEARLILLLSDTTDIYLSDRPGDAVLTEDKR